MPSLATAAEVGFDVAAGVAVIAVVALIWTGSFIAVQVLLTAAIVAALCWFGPRETRRANVPTFNAPRHIPADYIEEGVSETDLAEDAWEREEGYVPTDTGVPEEADGAVE